jgi:hypothetical protein
MRPLGLYLLSSGVVVVVDACAFDDAAQVAFGSNGKGTVAIAQQETPERLRVTQILSIERGAYTTAFDPQTPNLSGDGKVRTHAFTRARRLAATAGDCFRHF